MLGYAGVQAPHRDSRYRLFHVKRKKKSPVEETVLYYR